jgi:hypothetical protein
VTHRQGQQQVPYKRTYIIPFINNLIALDFFFDW